VPALAEVFVRARVDNTGFGNELSRAVQPGAQQAGRQAGREMGGSMRQSMLASVRGLGPAIIGAAGLAGGAAVFQKIIGGASDLNAAMGSTRQVFQGASQDVINWSTNTANSLGIARSAALAAAKDFGGFFTSVGLSESAAADMSKTWVEMAANMAAFADVDPTRALNAMQSALRGEMDPLQTLIPTISNAAVVTRAMADSGVSNAEALTMQQKALALNALMLESTANKAGKAELAAGGYAQQVARLNANLTDAAAKLGQNLIPALTGVTRSAGDVVGIFGSMNLASQAFVLSAIPLAIAGNRIMTNFGTATGAVRGFSDTLRLTAMYQREAVITGGAHSIAAQGTANAVGGASGAIGRYIGSIQGANAANGRWAASAVAATGGARLFANGIRGVMAALGPLNIAIAAVTFGIFAYAQRQQEAKQRATELRERVVRLNEAIKESGGVVDSQVSSIVRGDPALRQMITRMREVGVSFEEVNKASSGDKAAIDDVTRAYDARLRILEEEKETLDKISTNFSAEGRKRFSALTTQIDALKGERDAIKQTGEEAAKADKELDNLDKTTQKLSPSAATLRDMFELLADKTKTAEERAKELKSAWDELFGVQVSQTEASEAYQASLDTTNAKLKELVTRSEEVSAAEANQAKALSATTEAGREARDAIEERLEKSRQLYEADIAAGVSIGSATKAHTDRVTALRNELTQMGFNKTETEKLIAVYGLVPTELATAVKFTNDEEAKAAAAKLKAAYDKNPKLLDTTVRLIGANTSVADLQNLYTNIYPFLLATDKNAAAAFKKSVDDAISKKTFGHMAGGEGFASGRLDYFGNPIKKAAGGYLRGPGTTTSDSIPALLSDQEFVEPADAVKYYGPDFFEALRQRRIPKASLPGFAGGGWVMDLRPRMNSLMSKFRAWGERLKDAAAIVDMPGAEVAGQIMAKAGATGWVWPTPGHRGITAPFGQNRGSYSHGGTDIGAPSGASILAALAGRVIQSGWYGGGGNTVSLSHANGLVSRYMHMSQILARRGQSVAAGQLIGRVGSTGDSTGPHLHFQLERGGRRINPMAFYDDGGWLMPGGINQTGKPEAVLSPEESAAFVEIARNLSSNKALRLDDYTISAIAKSLSAKPSELYANGKKIAETVSDAIVNDVLIAGG
jgi:septal ring factor EnvC (AmiA/AmiB activator)